jgi:DNA-binding MarR family transcriptional regulator
LIRRQSNPFDHRVIFVELSDRGRAAIDQYLMMLRAADMFGPVPIDR